MTVGSLGSVAGLLALSGVLAVLLAPVDGWDDYTRYRPPLFVAGVVFVSIFVFIASLLEGRFHASVGAWFLLVSLAVLFLGAVSLAHPNTRGDGPEMLSPGPMLSLRFDLLAPTGLVYVAGVVLLGAGTVQGAQAAFGTSIPTWRWWGLVPAVLGAGLIVVVRPLVRTRYWAFRTRSEGYLSRLSAQATGQVILFAGVLLLGYGLVQALAVGSTSPLPRLSTPATLPGLLALGVAFLILGPVLSVYGVAVDEGAGSTRARYGRALLSWFGTVTFLYALVALFAGDASLVNGVKSPSVGALGLVGSDNLPSAGFRLPVRRLGTALWLAGSFLLLVVRPVALRREFDDTVRVVATLLSAESPPTARTYAIALVESVADAPAPVREAAVETLVETLDDLPEPRRERLAGALAAATQWLDADRDREEPTEAWFPFARTTD